MVSPPTLGVRTGPGAGPGAVRGAVHTASHSPGLRQHMPRKMQRGDAWPAGSLRRRRHAQLHRGGVGRAAHQPAADDGAGEPQVGTALAAASRNWRRQQALVASARASTPRCSARPRLTSGVGLAQQRAASAHLDDQAGHHRTLVARQLAPDQVVGLDAGGAFVDGGDARVALVLRRAGLLDEAHAAVHLHAVGDQLTRLRCTSP